MTDSLFDFDDESVQGSSTPQAQAMSVRELTARVKDCLQRQFSSLWVVGEISDLARPQSGHVYLTLKDSESQIRAVIWRATAARVDFPLEDGCEVVCRGDLDVYPPRGTYQLVIRQVEQRGEGSLQKKLRELQKQLAAEGLFDQDLKQPLPRIPQRVAVITSPTGAAIRDFLQVASRRWRGSKILIMPTPVQGAAASRQIAASIRNANKLTPRPDVVVVTRGGGSMEDLWCFNDESVVRSIHRSKIPVVSAIGHEIDVTLADLVADVRATTPSEAAERIFPSRDDLQQTLQATRQRMVALLHHRVVAARTNLTSLADRSVIRRPFELTERLSRMADELSLRSTRAMRGRLESARAATQAAAGRLEALSPLKVLGRGYSVTLNEDGKVVSSASSLEPGDNVTTRLADGKISSKVTSVDNRLSNETIGE